MCKQIIHVVVVVVVVVVERHLSNFYKVSCTKRATFPRKSKLHDLALESTFAKIICN